MYLHTARFRCIQDTRFFISKNCINSTRLKFAKNQIKAKQQPEAELLLFENYLEYTERELGSVLIY